MIRRHHKRAALGLAWLVIIPLTACGEGPTDQPEERTVILVVSGTVTEEPGGSAIQGATVDLGFGGHFSMPTVRKSTVTDASGHYEIVDTLTYAEPCPFQWMQASASGYVGIRGIEDSRVGVLCTTARQTIDIPLAPAP